MKAEGVIRSGSTVFDGDRVVSTKRIPAFSLVAFLYPNRFEPLSLRSVYHGSTYSTSPHMPYNAVYIQDVLDSPSGMVAMRHLLRGDIERFLAMYTVVATSVANVVNDFKHDVQHYISIRDIPSNSTLYTSGGAEQWIERMACGLLGRVLPFVAFKCMLYLTDEGLPPLSLLDLDIYVCRVRPAKVVILDKERVPDNVVPSSDCYVACSMARYVLVILYQANPIPEDWSDFIAQLGWPKKTARLVRSMVLFHILSTLILHIPKKPPSVDSLHRMMVAHIHPVVSRGEPGSKYLKRILVPPSDGCASVAFLQRDLKAVLFGRGGGEGGDGGGELTFLDSKGHNLMT